MSFDHRLYLKWLEASNPLVKNYNFTLVNQCVVTASREDKVLGLTVAEPRALTDSFVKRIEQRRSKPDMDGCKFRLYAPKFLRHRAQTLIQSLEKAQVEVIYTGFVHFKHSGDQFVLRDKLRVVSVDDSPVLLKYLQHEMSQFGYVDVVAQVSDSKNAVETILEMKPDVVTMDMQMPKKNGFEVTRDLLQREYFPVIVVSSLEIEEGSLVIDALNAGAFDYLQKPKLENKKEFAEQLEACLLTAIDGRRVALKPVQKREKPKADAKPVAAYQPGLIWCMGASTGGTQALTRVFTSMPTHIPPTIIVQHIPPVFSKSFADSLNNLCPFTVSEAKDGDCLEPDHVYVAPGGFQMGIEMKNGKLHLTVRDLEPVNRFKPSVDFTFLEVAKLKGFQIVAAIYTGMGRDGAKGLKTLKDGGAMTLAQDEMSCAVFGMPRAAIELGAAQEVVTLDGMAQAFLTHSVKFKAAG